MYLLLQEQLLEENYPYAVEPTDDDTGRNCYEDTNNESDKTALLKPSGPSNYDFCDVVNYGDKEQENLNQTALLVKPCHKCLPP